MQIFHPTLHSWALTYQTPTISPPPAPTIIKPIIVLVDDAWHHPIHFSSFSSQLRAAGFDVVIPALASSGPKDSSIIGKTVSADIQIVHDTVAPYLDAGSEIILVLHSLSGIAGSHSAMGFTVEDRESKGLRGGVKAVIYIDAAAPVAPGMYGLRRRELAVEMPYCWDVECDFTVADVKMLSHLHHDVTPEVAASAARCLVKQSMTCFQSLEKHVAAEVGCSKVYVLCGEDNGLNIESQLRIAAAGGYEVVRMQCGHCPFRLERETGLLVGVVSDAGELE